MRPLVVLAALLAAGCASGAVLEPAGSRRGENLGEWAPFFYGAPAGGFREVRALVVDRADGPPMVCTGDVGASDPPYCGDIALASWSWDRVDREFSTGGIRWGTFHFLGLLHRGRFYVTGFVE